MYSILRTFCINRIFAARTKFLVEWSHYGPDGVVDGEKHAHSTVPRHPVLQGPYCRPNFAVFISASLLLMYVCATCMCRLIIITGHSSPLVCSFNT